MTTTAVQQETEREPWNVQGSSSEFATAAHFYDALGQRYEFAFTGQNYVGCKCHQFGCVLTRPHCVSRTPTYVDLHVTADDPIQLL